MYNPANMAVTTLGVTKPRRENQKRLTDKQDISVPIDYNNIPDILTPDYNIVIPDQVLEDVLQEQKQENPLELLVLYKEDGIIKVR